MWTLPRSDLKYRLTLRVVGVCALCLAAAYVYLLLDAHRSAHHRVVAIAEITAKDLELQQSKRLWLRAEHPDFPDLTTSASVLMAPGLCIAYRTPDGTVVQRVCSGSAGDDAAPALFTAFYRKLFGAGHEVVHGVFSGSRQVGEAVVSFDPATQVAEVWHDAGRLIGPIAVTLLLLCVLVYTALARALRPTRTIRVALERITNNDLSTRLPPFDLAELSAIRDVVNQLAENLGTALAQRNELTRKLIALQDEERRHLARELHDEFGQCLAAIRALAAAARQSALTECPSILRECDSIARTATHMAQSLRGALFRLRPPDVDELGLAASLEGLIAGWNGRSNGKPRFEIRLAGNVGCLPISFGANLYRIAQEAITNAARHADATLVTLRLTLRDGESPADHRVGSEIELTVADNGQAKLQDPIGVPGMGLLGMRERVAALGGRLSFDVKSAGSTLRVVIPVVPVEVFAGAVCPA